MDYEPGWDTLIHDAGLLWQGVYYSEGNVALFNGDSVAGSQGE